MHVPPFRQRVKAPGEVEPPTRAWQPMPAHNPDLAWPTPREGAEEAFTKPSIGDAT